MIVVFDGHTLEMLAGQTTRAFGWAGGRVCVSVKIIHGLIKCRLVEYDFYNVAVSPAHGMNRYMSLLLVNVKLKSVLFLECSGMVLVRSVSVLPKALYNRKQSFLREIRSLLGREDKNLCLGTVLFR